jgi:hypothetical protein
MQLMHQLPGKHGPDILNKSVLKVALGSKGSQGLVQMTKKALKGKIERDLKRNQLGIKLAVRWLKSQGIKPTRAEIAKAYDRILKKRIISRAYIVAGWLFSAAKLAASTPGARLTRLGDASKWEGGSAKDSFARPATAKSLLSGIFNTSRGAGSVSPDALVQQAVNNATEDNAVYLRRKFGAGIDDAINGTNTAGNIRD